MVRVGLTGNQPASRTGCRGKSARLPVDDGIPAGPAAVGDDR